MVPRESTLIAIGYKYNAKKVLYFISTYDAGRKKPGISYSCKYLDPFSNVVICPVAH